MNRDVVRQWVTMLATVAVIVVNALANALPINGQTTGAVSDSFEVYFTPAGYVFSIWGAIYAALIAYSLYQALPAQRENRVLRAIAPFYWLSSLANIGWILLWHYERFPLTLAVMLVLLVSLIAIYTRLNVGREKVAAGMRWLVHLPFSLYLGWITVATIANATAVLWWAGWDGFGISAEAWMPIVLAVALVIAALMALTRRDTVYLLVLVWAFTGIAVKHPDVPLVTGSAIAATVIVALLAVWTLLPRRLQPLRQSQTGDRTPA